MPQQKGKGKSGSTKGSPVPSEAGDLTGDLAALEATIVGRFDGLQLQIASSDREVQKKLTELESSIAFLNGKYEEVLQLLAAQKSTVTELHKGQEALRELLRTKDATINQLTARVNQLEQSTLNTSLELHNVPDIAGKSLEQTVSEIASELGVPEPDPSETDMYRQAPRKLRAPGTQTPPGVIVLRFKATSKREEWLRGKKKLVPPGRPLPPPGSAAAAVAGAGGGAAVQQDRKRLNSAPFLRIYEQLTPYNKRLLFLARCAAREKEFEFVWVRGGKIFARKSERLPGLIQIRCEDDIRKKMGWNVPTADI